MKVRCFRIGNLHFHTHGPIESESWRDHFVFSRTFRGNQLYMAVGGLEWSVIWEKVRNCFYANP